MRNYSMFFVAAIILLAAGCKEEKIDVQIPEETSSTYSFNVSEDIWQEGETKTQFNGTSIVRTGLENIAVFYEDGDKMIFSNDKNDAWKATPDGETPGKYNIDGAPAEMEGKTVYPLMPYAKNLMIKGLSASPSVYFNLNSVQMPSANSFDATFDLMVGKPFTMGTSANVTCFKRVFAPFVLNIAGLEADEKIYACTFMIDTPLSSTNYLVGRTQVNLSKDFEDAGNYSLYSTGVAGNGVTAIYDNGLSKRSDVWPVWYIVNPITIWNGTSVTVTVTTKNKTYKRTAFLTSNFVFQKDKFNELTFNIKGAGYTECNSFTQMFMSADLSSGTHALTASDGIGRSWGFSTNLTWNGSTDYDMENSLSLYNTRTLTLPTDVTDFTSTNISIYPHPCSYYTNNGDKYLSIKSGSTTLGSIFYNLATVSSKTGSLAQGGLVDVSCPSGLSSFSGLKLGGFNNTPQPTLCGITVRDSTSANKIVLNLSFSRYSSLSTGVFLWPFDEAKPGTLATSSASYKYTRSINTMTLGGKYVFSVSVGPDPAESDGIGSNTLSGLVFGKIGAKLTFPGIPGYKLTEVYSYMKGSNVHVDIKGIEKTLTSGLTGYTFSLTGTTAGESCWLEYKEGSSWLAINKLRLTYEKVTE